MLLSAVVAKYLNNVSVTILQFEVKLVSIWGILDFLFLCLDKILQRVSKTHSVIFYLVLLNLYRISAWNFSLQC